MKKLIKQMTLILDIILSPFVLISAVLQKNIRKYGVHHFPLCKKILLVIGVFPIRKHYYEPQFDFNEIKDSLSKERNLTGINWNIDEQLALLKKLSFTNELNDLPDKKNNDIDYYLNNKSFESGDAEFWYQLIRAMKPKRIFEIGSGYSTLMAIKAIQKNVKEHSGYQCKHVCIEPYEKKWLEKTNITVIRKKVEDIDPLFFADLEENDILFIDSSHIIRPEGDVLYEYLQLLPTLKKGVIVHIHDIFSPRNYLNEWLLGDIKFWNEQYLLEAFLIHNTSWKIIASLNYLHHSHFDELKTVCPFLTTDREPGSFYIQKIN